MKKIKILLVDDHALIRAGIRNSLINQEHIEVLAEAMNGAEALSQLTKTDFDLVIMDLSMPEMNGTEATRLITEKYPDVNVLILSMHNEEARIREALKAGAMGYILKSTSMAELLEAVETVSKGEPYFTREVSAKIMNQLVRGKENEHANTTSRLTNREMEILKLISEEFTNQEIATKLFISPRTVDTHRRNLIQKLHAKNTAGLVRYAIRHKIAEV
ncbi:MAG: response regulator transcription factor [Roseivirga sp.]|nr:response regulator transcription factor [Roseivirga sp.]